MRRFVVTLCMLRNGLQAALSLPARLCRCTHDTFEDGCRPRTHSRQRHCAEHPQDYGKGDAAIAVMHGTPERQLHSSMHKIILVQHTPMRDL